MPPRNDLFPQRLAVPSTGRCLPSVLYLCLVANVMLTASAAVDCCLCCCCCCCCCHSSMCIHSQSALSDAPFPSFTRHTAAAKRRPHRIPALYAVTNSKRVQAYDSTDAKVQKIKKKIEAKTENSETFLVSIPDLCIQFEFNSASMWTCDSECA